MSKPARAGLPGGVAVGLCAVLLGLFATLSWRAVSTKSPTYDEVYHAPAGWVSLWWGDYRVDFENPPLWKYWASLPNGRGALKVDFDSPTWREIPEHLYLEWWWCVRTLFKTEGNHGDEFIQRSRAMMLPFGVVLGILIAWWAWRVGGPLGAVVATGLFSFDPNFLGHSALVKNDVLFALCLLGLMYVLWRAGQRLTWGWLIGIAMMSAIMVNVKLSGVIMAAVLVPGMLLLRAVHGKSWWMLGRERKFFRDKAIVVMLTVALSVAAAYALIWADYRFRFLPTADPAIQLNMQELVDQAKRSELVARQQAVTDQAVAAEKSGLGVEAVLFANRHQLLPQPWLGGLLFQYATSRVRSSFLLGENRIRGWWYYFPVAMAVKTPVSTEVGGVLSLVVGLIAFWKRPSAEVPGEGERGRGNNLWWTWMCLWVPMGVYLLSAMSSNLNIGIRHVLGVYPFAYILMGCAAGFAFERWGRRALGLVVVLGVVLAIECLAIFPDYIAFFNFALGGERAGIHLLADSNLDWGQDLKLLAKWQQQHPDDVLYLSYFGLSAPDYYGIRYVPIRGGYSYDLNPTMPTGPGVVAVSASNLQQLFPDPVAAPLYHTLLESRPIEVLGGTIYLYRWPGEGGASPERQARWGF